MLRTAAAFVALTHVVSAAFDPDFYSLPWGGTCATGERQSPINVYPDDAVPPPDASHTTRIQMPVAREPFVKCTGYSSQVEWASLRNAQKVPRVPVAGSGISDLLLDPSLTPDGFVRVQPIQFHFHVVSEHAIGGKFYAGELHVVTLVAKGERPEWGCDAVWNGGEPNLEKCAAVFGMVYELGNTTPAYLKTIIDATPSVKDATASLGSTFDLSQMLPDSLEHWTYVGSLTTPPCAEGLRWHVLTTPQTIAAEDVEKYRSLLTSMTETAGSTTTNNFLTNFRLPQNLNARTVYTASDAVASSSATASGR